MIEPEIRKEFERSGLETIRFLAIAGNFNGGDHIRSQALEWIAEQTDLHSANEILRATQQSRILLWTKISASAAIIAAIIATIPVIRGH